MTIAHDKVFCFLDLFDKPVVAKFDQEQASSDGGAIRSVAAGRCGSLDYQFILI
jgi:hypothetical protein